MMFGERPTKAAIASVHYLSYLFLLTSIAAMVAWIVYVAKWNVDVYNKVASGEKTAYPMSALDELAHERFTICFQAVVASVLIYFAFRHMHHKLEA